jgi:excisionase family DNA binding protein
MKSIRQQWLSIPETAQYFGVSTRTVRRWNDSGELGYMRVGASGQPRISREMIAEFVEANLAQVREQEMVSA